MGSNKHILTDQTTDFSSSTSNHYQDIQSLQLTLAKSRSRQKNIKEKRPTTIWTENEPEKTNTFKKVKSKQKSKTDSKKSSETLQPKTFLENPIFENELRNWTLPRVELWCRDPNCVYNQHLWGNHYTNQHHGFPQGVATSIPEIEEDSGDYHTGQSTRSTYYNSHTSNSDRNSDHKIPSEHDISINSVPMVLNTHRSNKGPRGHSNSNMIINMNMGINNLSTKDGFDGSFATKADNNFTNTSVMPSTTNNTKAKGSLTMTQTDTMASSITTHSSTKSSNTDTTILTIHTGGSGESAISPDGSSASTFITGFESSTEGSGSTKPVDHDIVDYQNSSRNPPNVYNHSNASSGYPSLPYSHQGFRASSTASSNPFCPNCSGVVPLNHLDTVSDVGRLKGEPGFWNFNRFQHPLQRDHSFHSVGGFTLNGQYNTSVKKNTMLKFCSSHKISLVVSTFSLLVTIGLLITLFLMKKRGMMDTMMDS